MSEKQIRDCKVLIIGSGPAGLSAAIYTGRAGLAPVIISGPTFGGQASLTADIENYPGFVDSVSGSELMDKFREQAEKFGAEIVSDVVEKVDFSAQPLVVETGITAYRCERVIITAGSNHLPLNVPGEKEFTGRGVSYCATCDGAFFKGKRVAVVGGGDTAMADALYLARLAGQVTVIHRRDAFRASKIMADRVLATANIEVLWDSVVEEVLGVEQRAVSGLRIRNVKTGAITERALEGVFIAIGHQPNTAPFAGQIELDSEGYIKTEWGHCSVPGVFAAGDVQDRRYKQAITAAGSGCVAALECERYLASL